jgi:hypothetical protein
MGDSARPRAYMTTVRDRILRLTSSAASSSGGRALLLVISVALITACSTPPETPPTRSATPAPTVAATPAAGLTRGEAVALARKATTRFAGEGVLEARVGTWGELDVYSPPDAPPTPAPETRVWIINLGYVAGPLDGQGVVVVLDEVDGRVLSAIEWMS